MIAGWKLFMVPRITATLFVLLAAASVSLLACASRNAGEASAKAAAKEPGFSTEEKRMMACLDLRDHIVDLYADEYVEEQGLSMSGNERVAFRHGWAEELARKGTFERFEQSCFYGLTPRKYECGMASTTTDGLTACMKLSAR
jgi:hypothetical protein